MTGSAAVVKSPDRVKDLITGKLREVDASVRFRLGSVETLFVIECRHRGRIQDVCWIEQLATKGKSIGAARVIAVSQRGFSKEALDAGRRYGVETRVVSTIQTDEIKSWVSAMPVEHTKMHCRMLQVRIGTFDKEPDDTLHFTPELSAAMKADWFNAAVVQQEGTTKSIADFVRQKFETELQSSLDGGKLQGTLQPGGAVSLYTSSLGYLLDGIPEDGLPHQVRWTLLFPERTATVATLRGPRHVRLIEIDIEGTKHPTEALDSTGATYSTGDGEKLITYAESEVPADRGRLIVARFTEHKGRDT